MMQDAVYFIQRFGSGFASDGVCGFGGYGDEAAGVYCFCAAGGEVPGGFVAVDVQYFSVHEFTFYLFGILTELPGEIKV